MYGFAVKLRNIAYDKGIFEIKKLPIPVISVGNISVGGSGKTPTVRFIAENVLKNKKVCILLRGYKRKSKGTLIVSYYGDIQTDIYSAGDEAYMLSKMLKNTSVVVSEDRYQGGLVAVKELGADIVILDDGFQHRRLYRDLDIVLLRKRDLKDKLLPFGRLREPLSSLKRADAVVLSYQEIEPFDIEIEKPTFKMIRKFEYVYKSNMEKIKLNEKFLEREFIAVSGLGDNEQFLNTLRRLKFKIKKHLSFRDHHDYSGFKPSKEENYITTLKDLFKIGEYDNVFALDVTAVIEGLDIFIMEKLL